MNLEDKQTSFAKFKNLLLGQSFLHDPNYFVVLGREHQQFWGHIHENPPFLGSVPGPRLDVASLGRIVWERIEIEPSPRRMSELLQGLFKAMQYDAYVSKYGGDMMWRKFVGDLKWAIEKTEFSDLHADWTSDPQKITLPELYGDSYWMPGEFEIYYDGPDWGTAESKVILVNGFKSKVIGFKLEQERLEKERIEKKEKDKKETFKMILGFLKSLLPWKK